MKNNTLGFRNFVTFVKYCLVLFSNASWTNEVYTVCERSSLHLRKMGCTCRCTCICVFLHRVGDI